MRGRSAIVFCLLAAAGCGVSTATIEAPPAEQEAPDWGVEHRVDGRPVAATLRLARARARAGETIEVAVQLDIAPQWEVRTLDSQFAGAATKIELELPPALEARGEWRAPRPGPSISGDGHPAYAGEVVFTRELMVRGGAGEQPLKCRVSYQACDARQCLAPTEVELAATVRIE
jgi:hypothetical protein